MFSFIIVIFLMATVRPVARHHGGDGGGRDPNHPRQHPAQCDEASKLYKYELAILYFVRNNIWSLFFFVGTTSRTQKKKGYKQNKLNSMEDLRKKAESSQLDIEFDEVETYKAVGNCSANFNNVIGMITRDLLEPYFFYWKH